MKLQGITVILLNTSCLLGTVEGICHICRPNVASQRC